MTSPAFARQPDVVAMAEPVGDLPDRLPRSGLDLDAVEGEADRLAHAPAPLGFGRPKSSGKWVSALITG